MPRGRPYSHQDNLAIIEAFQPRAERIEAVARDLGRTPAAVTRQYYRLLALHRVEPQHGAANLEVAQ